MRAAGLVVALGLALAAGCQVDPAHLPEMTFDLPKDKEWASTPLAPPPGPGEGRIYVTDNLEDTISIIDLDSAEAGAPVLLAKVPVGFVPVEREGPHHVSVDQKGKFYYYGVSNFVPGSGSGPHGVHGAGTIDGHMVKVSVDTNEPVAEVRVQPNPGDVRLTPDGETLLATHFDLVKLQKGVSAGITTDGPDIDATLAIIDPATMTRKAFVDLCPASHGIAITPDSSTAVTSCYSDEVAIVDLVSDDHPVTRVPVLAEPGAVDTPICEPYSVTLAGTTAWAGCFQSGQLIGVDVPSKTLTGQVLQLSGVAAFGDVRDGVMVVAHQRTDGITFIDVSGPEAAVVGEYIANPGDCQLPHVARFNEDGTKVFAVCEGNHSDPGTFIVIDAAAPHALLGKVELGVYPDDIAQMRRPG